MGSITSYGYVVKNPSITVLDASIKMAFKLLNAKKESFKTLFNASPDATLVSDASTGIIVNANTAAEHLFGIPRENLVGMHHTQLYSNDQRDVADGAFNEAAEQELFNSHPVPLEFVIETPSGVKKTVELVGNIFHMDTKLYLLAAFRDITERKQVDEHLRQVLNEYDAVFNGTQDAMFLVDVIDVDTYRYIRNNRAHAEGSGLTMEQLQNKTPQDLLGNELGNAVAANYRRCYQAGHTISYEETLDLPGGTKTWATTLTPIFDRRAINHLVGAAHDITERKKAEKEILRQLTEKVTLLREVHHRIKNNMAQVEGLLSLQADSVTSAEAKTALKEAILQVRSIRSLYEKLLVRSGYDTVSIKNYLDGLIDSLGEVFNTASGVTIKKRLIDFEIDSEKAVPIGIILNELVTNAFKYAFKGRDDGHVCISLDRSGSNITLTVEDDGTGFDQKTVENTTSGFGLSLVEMLAEQLGGACTIVSDTGTRSVVNFPV